MFNRYWRSYPWGMQVLLFFSTWFTLFSFSAYLVLALVPKLTGLNVSDFTQLSAATSERVARIGLIVQGCSHAGMYALPGLLFAVFTHPGLREYLGLRAPGKAIHWLLVTGIMLGLIPVFLWGEAWSMQHLHFGKWADDLQKTSNDMFAAFLHLDSPGDLVLLIVILALLPAVGEEIVFRGILLRLLHRRTNRMRADDADANTAGPDAQQTMMYPVIFTSLLFSAIHMNPHGLVFIFIAACILSLVYFLTGSLLCSIWAHLLYNGTQVLAVYVSAHSSAAQKAIENENLPIAYPLAGLALFGICFYLLVKDQTPLPANWSDDFRNEKPTVEEA